MCGKVSSELARKVVFAEDKMDRWHYDAIVLANRENHAKEANKQLDEALAQREHQIQIDSILKKHRQKMWKLMQRYSNEH